MSSVRREQRNKENKKQTVREQDSKDPGDAGPTDKAIGQRRLSCAESAWGQEAGTGV
jgi:hypothetical protein